jgi:hypothetical protein
VEAQAGVHVGYAVAGARTHARYSWAQVAGALGTTRQSAQERFGDVPALPTQWTPCGEAVFTDAARFLHLARCSDARCVTGD